MCVISPYQNIYLSSSSVRKLSLRHSKHFFNIIVGGGALPLHLTLCQ
jgi:hypothetical protein